MRRGSITGGIWGRWRTWTVFKAQTVIPRLAIAGATDPTLPCLSSNADVHPRCLSLHFSSSHRAQGKQPFRIPAPPPQLHPRKATDAFSQHRLAAQTFCAPKGRSRKSQTALLGWETPLQRRAYECEQTDVRTNVHFCVRVCECSARHKEHECLWQTHGKSPFSFSA